MDARPAEDLPPDKGHSPARANWRALAFIRAQRLRNELELAERVGAKHPASSLIAAQIRGLLSDAQTAATQRGFLRGVVIWITGAEIEQTWAALHQADELLYLVHDAATVRARAPELLATVRSRLATDDARRAIYETALQSESIADDREILREIRKNVNEINDDAHGRLRNFRNVALAATVMLSIGMAIVAADPPEAPWLPITHGKPPWATVWQIELVGALGGLLAGVTALRALQGFAGPYGVPIVMATLKVPAGALTGLLGALWMQNSVLGVLSPQDGVKILAYVALFGFAQQAFTTFADRQAGQLLGQAKGNQPASGSGVSP